MRPLGSPATRDRTRSVKTAHSAATYAPHQVPTERAEVRDAERTARQAEEQELQLPGQVTEGDDEQVTERQEATSSFHQRRFAKAHKLIGLLPA